MGKSARSWARCSAAWSTCSSASPPLEEVLKEHGQIIDDEIEEANERGKNRWERGLMIDALFDTNLAVLLEELRRRMGDAETS